MTEFLNLATESSPKSQPKAEAKEENLSEGILEAADDPEFRRFMDERERNRQKIRLAQRPPWENDPPTPKQLAYLRFLGHRDVIKTKGEAARVIGELVGAKK